MSRVRVNSFLVSLDGFAAGHDQSEADPFGVGGPALHAWLWETEFGRSMIGQPGGSTGLDNEWLRRGEVNVGATVMGRNMFGPVRGDWPDDSWTGWWGEDPPYRHPVFVLTHYARQPLAMAGGTTFYFVTDGLDSALAQAKEAAQDRDVRIGGGVATVREALQRQLVDDVHLCVVPVLLGSGEQLWTDIGTWPQGYACTQIESAGTVAHFHFERA